MTLCLRTLCLRTLCLRTLCLRTLCLRTLCLHAISRAATATALLVTLTGCPDGEARFDEFAQRYETLHPPGSNAPFKWECATPPTDPAEITGDYLFALSAELGPETPILFDTKVTAEAGLTFSMVLQPLQSNDRKTPVGAPIDVGPFDIATDGGFTAELPPLNVPGAANAISGTDISAEVTLFGGFCLPIEVPCGELTGKLTKPFDYELTPDPGSDFTMAKLKSPGAYPEPPPINCDGDLAIKL